MGYCETLVELLYEGFSFVRTSNLVTFGRVYAKGEVLTGDAQHLGLLIGMNTEDPYCVVLRIECEDIMPLHDALIECFGGIDIEMDEDVDDVPWPFE